MVNFQQYFGGVKKIINTPQNILRGKGVGYTKYLYTPLKFEEKKFTIHLLLNLEF